jgi:hypothetical protein
MNERRRGPRRKTLWDRLQPADLVALFIIAAYVFLAWKGVVTMLNTAVILIVGFYFGHQTSRMSIKND